MGWRFRKSFKLLPGVRLNLGAKSASISVGGMGFHKTISTTGRVTNSFGIPGTGLYYTESSTSGSRSRNNRLEEQPQAETVYSTPVQAAEPVVDVYAIKESIKNIYRVADDTVDWRRILVDKNAEPYFKERAEKILDGDIDTYFEVISDVNPLDDLLQYGSDFECGTDDPRKMSIHFHVNSDVVLRNARGLEETRFNDLLQDYVCGCAIRIARDMFALLPLRHMIVDARDGDKEILSVDFEKKSFDKLDIQNIDASDTIESFEHRMNFSPIRGFGAITPLDDSI